MPHLHTLALRLERAIIDAYDAAHGITRRSAETAAWRLDQAEANLAAAIGPDRRTLAELSARNMSKPDPKGGDFLAASWRRWFASYVAHEYKHGGTPRPGVKGCQHREWCSDTIGMWCHRREIMARAIEPGRTVARLVLSHSIMSYHGQAAVQGFFADGCGGPVRGDWLGGGRPQVPRMLKTDEVDDYMARTNQPWRIVTRDAARDAIVAAGYRMCTEPGHWHEFVPADAGPDVWRPSRVDERHTDYGARIAFVVRRNPGDEKPTRLPDVIPL